MLKKQKEKINNKLAFKLLNNYSIISDRKNQRKQIEKS